MMQSGASPDDVARIFDVSRAIAYRWNQAYEKHGASALEIKKAPGRTPSLTPEQRGKIFALISGSNPAQMQLDFGELWTRKNVREMIRREFRVKLSDVQVGRVLRDIGLSPQKPLYRGCIFLRGASFQGVSVIQCLRYLPPGGHERQYRAMILEPAPEPADPATGHRPDRPPSDRPHLR